jgi:hypothetical protein
MCAYSWHAGAFPTQCQYLQAAVVMVYRQQDACGARLTTWCVAAHTLPYLCSAS